MSNVDLKALRERLGLNQAEMCKLLGISKGYYSKLELGNKPITKEMEQKIKKLSVNHSEQASVEAKIDFLRIRFKSFDVEAIIENLLHMDMNWFSYEARGFYRYTETFCYGDIRIFRNKDDVHMGCMLDLSGNGCRQLEEIFQEDHQRTWIELFRDLYDSNIFGEGKIIDTKITRIDIALDERIEEGKKNFDLYVLKEKIEQGLVDTTFKNYDFTGGFSYKNNQLINKGLSLYFGSRQSPIYFNFYQKDYELAKKESISVEEAREKHKIKNRYEIRLSDEKAFLFVEYFLSSGETLEWLVQEVINQSLSVYDLKNGEKVISKDWHSVIGKMEGIKLSVSPKKPTIEKTLRWLSNYLAPSLRMIQVIDKELGTNELLHRIENAELKEKHEKMIEQVTMDSSELLFRNQEKNEFFEDENVPF